MRGEGTWRVLPPIEIDLDSETELLHLDPSVPVERPYRFRLEGDSRQRRISWRLLSPGAVLLLLFMFLVEGGVAFVLFHSAGTANLPWQALTALLAVTALSAYAVYRALVHIVDRATLRLDPARVSLELAPLPWFGARNIARADIALVFCVKINETFPDSTTQRRPTYTVRLALADGRTLDLARGLRAPEEALFIEQQIREPWAPHRFDR